MKMKNLTSEKMIGVLALLVAFFIAGGLMPSVIRIGLRSFHPFIFNFLRAVFTLVLLFPVLIKYKNYFLNKKVIKLIPLLGLGIGLNILFFSLGINLTTLTASQLIYAMVPVFVSIIAFFMIKEKFNKNKLGGLLLALLGTTIMFFFSSFQAERLSLGSFKGNILILFAAMFYSFYLVYSKRLTKNYPPVFIAALTYLSLTFFFSLFAIATLFTNNVLFKFNWPSILGLLVTAVLSALFLILLQIGVKRISVSSSSLFNLLSPGFAAIMGILFFGEKFSFLLIVSLTLIMGGILLSINQKLQNKLIYLIKKIVKVFK